MYKPSITVSQGVKKITKVPELDKSMQNVTRKPEIE